MRPKPTNIPLEEHLKPILVNIIDLSHPLCKLSQIINWEKLEEEFGKMYSEKGRPGKPIRLMIGLQYLKYTYNLSDEEVVYRWLENPYWQYVTGETVFQTELPIDPTSMTRFRKRLKKDNLLKLLEITIETGFKSGYLKSSDVKRVSVDTTVQEKNISYPTDIKLYYVMMKYLVRFAKKNGIELKQTYLRVTKRGIRTHSGLVHSKKYSKANKLTSKVKTNMGRLYRDLERKLPEVLRGSEEFKQLTFYFKNLESRNKHSKDKLYSLYHPEVECIGKGKTHKKYEFGNKVGIVNSLTRNFVLGVTSFKKNVHDSKTLAKSLDDASNVIGDNEIKEALVDLGFRGHNYKGNIKITVVPRNLKKFSHYFRRILKKRASIEALISHIKRNSRMDRNYLKGHEGNEANAILSGCGHNLRMLLAFLLFFLKNLLEIMVMSIQKTEPLGCKE
jgi:IS5 family transposase